MRTVQNGAWRKTDVERGARLGVRVAMVLAVGLALVLASGCGNRDDGAICGERTTLSDGMCVPVDDLCGEGTVRRDGGTCVAVDTFCGEGTTFDRGTGRCAGEGAATCGAGTRLEDGRCVLADEGCSSPLVVDAESGRCVMPSTACGSGTVRDADTGRCVASDERCPPGEAWSDSRTRCSPIAEVCGEGTRWDDAGEFCRPEASYCGTGVEWDAEQERCVGDGGAGGAGCGPGTELDDDGELCVLVEDICGAGTVWDEVNEACVLGAGVCGPGTVREEEGDRCLASADVCGTRTRWDEDSGRCLADEDVCGPGTRWVAFAGGCLPDEEPGARCGANTVWDEDSLTCVPDPELCTGGAVFDAEGRCVVPEEACGEGTAWDAELLRCTATEELCEDGTAWDADNGRCVASPDVCGDGTVWNPDARVCEPVGLTCGAGTVFDETANACVASAEACGTGTSLVDGTCVPSAEVCGAGTSWAEGRCVIAETACLEGTVYSEEEEGCIPSADVCGPGTTWVEEERRCFRGTLVFGDCEDPPTLGNVREDTILPTGNCYLVTGVRDVAGGAMLTIEPGVTLLFEAAAGFSATGTGVLRVLGTEDEPVLMSGVNEEPGFWRGLRIAQSNSPLNRLQHLIVEYAGDTPWDSGVETSRAGIVLQSNGGDARLSITDVTSRYNFGYGMSVRSAIGPSVCATAGYVTIDEFARNTFHDNSVSPLRIFNDIAGAVDAESSFTGNTHDRVDVYGGNCRAMISNQTWVDPGVPYRSVGRFELTPGTRLTLEEGVEIRFVRETGMDLRGVVVARGTADRPVVLTGDEGTPGSWLGVRWTNNTGPDSLMEHVVIENGGSEPWEAGTSAGLTITSISGAITARLRNVTVRNTLGTGLLIHGAEVELDVFEDNTFTGNSAYPVIVSARQATRLDANSSYVGNGIDAIRIRSLGMIASAVGAISSSGTLRNVGLPWLAAEGLRVRDGATLTIEEGVTMRFALNTWFRVGDGNSAGYIRVMGSPEEPVVMEGSMAVAGWWRGFFMGNSLNPLNEINYLTVRHGGSEQWSATQQPANVHLTGQNGNSRLRVNGLRMEDGLGAGLYVTTAVDLLSCEDITFDGVDPPVIGNVTHFEANCGALDPDPE